MKGKRFFFIKENAKYGICCRSFSHYIKWTHLWIRHNKRGVGNYWTFFFLLFLRTPSQDLCVFATEHKSATAAARIVENYNINWNHLLLGFPLLFIFILLWPNFLPIQQFWCFCDCVFKKEPPPLLCWNTLDIDTQCSGTNKPSPFSFFFIFTRHTRIQWLIP